MRVGDVVQTSGSLTVYFKGKEVRGSVGFKAPAGHRFVVLVLGSEPKDGSAPLDPVAVLKRLGWTPPDDLEPPAAPAGGAP